MFNGRWWIGIAIGLIALFATTISPAVIQKPGTGQEQAKGAVGKTQEKAKAHLGQKKDAGAKKEGLGMQKLGLSAEQQTAVREIKQWQMEQFKALKSSAQAKDKQEIVAQAGAIRDEANKRIAGVLTPDQAKTWQEMLQRKKEFRAKKGAGKIGRGTCPMPE